MIDGRDEQTFGRDSGRSMYGQFTPKDDTSIPVNIKNYSEEEIVRFLNDRLWGGYQAKNYQKMVDDIPQMHRAYEGIFKSQNFPRWRSQLYVRFGFKVVETLRAYFQDALMGNLPYIHVDPTQAKYAAQAKNHEKLFDYELYHTRFELRMMDVLNFALKYGTGVTKTYWRFLLGYRHDTDFTRNRFGFKEKKSSNGKKFLKWDDPWFDAIDPRKVIPDPQARYTDELRWVFEEYIDDLDQLRADKDRYGYFNLNRVYNEQMGYRQYGPRFEYVSRDVYPRNEWNSQLDQNRKRVFLDEYWGRLDLPGNHDDPRMYVVTMANNRHIIRLKPLPYAHGELPYQFFNIIPREENLFGIGAVEPVLADNYIMNALVNMRLDAMHYYLNPRILVNKGAFADRRSIEWSRPGELIQVNSGMDLGKTHQQLVIQDTGMSSWNDQMNWHARHGEETMAINPNAAGVLARSKRSATESSLAMEGANARFTSMVKMFKFSGFDNMIRQYGRLMQQYINEKEFPILHPELTEEKGGVMKLSAEDIQGEHLFRIRDNTITNRDVQQQLITNLLGVLAPISQALGPSTQQIMPALVKALLEVSPIANKINLDQVFPEALPEVMNQEQPGLEQILNQQGGGAPSAQGQYGAQGGTGQPGLDAQMQAVAEQMGGGGIF